GNVRLRAEVEKLLRAHLALGSFHEAPRSALSAAVEEPISERPGTIIGPYKLLHKIGEGGMGSSTWPSRRNRSAAGWPSRSSSPAWTPPRSSLASSRSGRRWP